MTSSSPVSSSTSISTMSAAWAKQETGVISPVSGSTSESGIRKMPRPETVRPCLNWAAPQASAVVMDFDGAPLTWMLPLPSVTRSAGSTSSSSAAASSITARASCAAWMTALPTRWVPRRGEAAHAVRAGVAVGGVDVDVLDRDAERLGGDLAGDGLHALAEVDGGEGDHELAAGVGVDQRLAGIAAEVHADRVVDRGEAAAAVDGHVSAS